MNGFEMITDGRMFNTVSLNVRSSSWTPYREEKAEKACERFIKASQTLSDNGYLGLKLSENREGGLILTAFSSEGINVTNDDYDWIFAGCFEREGDITEESGEAKSSADVYVLKECGKQDDPRGDGFISHSGEKDVTALIDEVEKERGEVSFLSTGCGSGYIVLRLSGGISLRMRTMLSLAFPETCPVEICAADSPDQIDVAGIPEERFRDSLSAFFSALMSRKLDTDRASEEDDEDLPDEVIYCEDMTPLEENELSIRSYTCLKRAGYNYWEELYSLTDEDFMKVRNLGRKSLREIRQKLSELRCGEREDTSKEDGPSGKSSLEKLEELVGLSDVKEQVKKIIAFASMKKDMETKGRGDISMVLNMEFTGNPGTAKTTVARLLAGIFHEQGLLPAKDPVEVGRADLIARYEGQTADKVRSVFERADGSVLFIDEAYALVEGFDGSFGDEAINTIVQEMENRRDRTVVIFAGYPGRMEEFFSRNPGLRSRVPFRIEFRDYSPEEMVSICELEAAKRGFTMDDPSKDKIISLCEQASNDPGMKNGRFCRNLVENAVLEYASRVYGRGAESPVNDFVLTADDFIPVRAAKAPAPAARIGFVA